MLALWLERKFNKREILELYLNRVYFGSGAYGIEAAAQRYFGKSARQLTLPEAAMLAGLVQSPSRLAPNHNPDGAVRRAAIVIADMAELKMIGESAAMLALAHPARAIKPAGRRLGQLCRRLGDGRGRRPDRQYRPGHRRANDHRSGAARRRRAGPGRRAQPEGRQAQYRRRRAGRHDAGRRGARAGRRARITATANSTAPSTPSASPARRSSPSSISPRSNMGSLPDTVREDAPIAVKGWKPENFEHQYARAGDADAGARRFAQYRVGAADARIRPRRGDAHRLSARHHLATRAQRFDRARHLGSLAVRAGIGLRDLRQWRARDLAACRRAHQERRRQDAL